MTLKEIYNIAVPEQKQKEERYSIWEILMRPISVLITIPFVGTKVKPTTITKISILSLFISFGLLSFGKTIPLKVCGWFFFFIWGMLDGVDGNLARCNDMCSPLGDLWDTMGGYAAMVLMYLSVGIASFYDSNRFVFFAPYWLLILGGFTAVFSIFPRLVMQKKKASQASSEAVKEFSDKSSFGLTKIIALNLISPSGLMQVIVLICIITHTLNLFITCYAFLNFAVMMMSLRKLLKE